MGAVNEYSSPATNTGHGGASRDLRQAFFSRAHWSRIATKGLRLSTLLGVILSFAYSSSSLPCLAAETIKAQAPPIQAETGSIKNILNLNDDFRQSYNIAKKEIRAHLGPVILLSKGKMILLKNGKREELPFIPEEWTVLKVADHITLAIFVMLTNHTDEKLSSEIVSRLENFRKLIVETEPEFKSLKYSGLGDKTGIEGSASEKRQESILKSSLEFLDGVIAARFVSFPDLQGFTRAVKDRAMENAYEAASFELHLIKTQVETWRSQMTDSEWNRLYVVISGSHMARKRETTSQYFLPLLKEKEEGRRVVYNEGSDDEEKSLDLLATHILDSRIAFAYFHDKMRMHRDLLGDGAAKYLKKQKLH